MYQRRESPMNDRGDGPGNNSRLIPTATPLPDASVLVASFAKRAWSSPKVKVGLLLWVIGFAFMVFAPAPVKVTPEMADTFDRMVHKATNLFPIQDALDDLAKAQASLYNSQEWFWRFKPDVREIVNKKQAIVDEKQAVVNELEAERAKGLSEANAYVGIWSEYGMQEVRERFWGAFESGKVFAKRQTFWSILLSAREENLMSTILQWIITALINFTLGLLGALFYFAFALYSMVQSYQPDSLSGLAFYFLAFLGGASMVATYLFGLYGMAAGGIYVAGKAVLRNAVRYERDQREELRRPRNLMNEHND